MFPSPPRSSLSKEVVLVTRAVPTPLYVSFCLEKDLCGVFSLRLRCTLTFWERSILRDVLECFSLHHFSLTCFKLHFLFRHGIHIKVCRREFFTAVHAVPALSGYLICKQFMVLWLTTLPGGREMCFCSVQLKRDVQSLFSHVRISLTKPDLPRHKLLY